MRHTLNESLYKCLVNQWPLNNIQTCTDAYTITQSKSSPLGQASSLLTFYMFFTLQQVPVDQKATSPPPTPTAERVPSTPTRQASSRNLSQSLSRRWPPGEQQSNVRSSFKVRTAQTELDEAPQTEYVHADEVPESPGSSPKKKFGPVGSIKRRTQPVQ